MAAELQETTSTRWPKFLAIGAGACSAALGLTVLVGWHTQTTALLQIHPSFVAMVYNTALAFLLCGLALMAVALDRRSFAVIGGIYAVLIGLLSLVEITFAKDLGIDQLLMRQYVLVGNAYPGRMALNTSILWILVGSGIIGLSVPRRFRLGPLAVGLIGSITFAQGLVAFSGYLTGITTTYAWGNLTRMAVHTAFGFGVLGVGLIALAWSDHRVGENKEAPRWLPIVVGVAIMAITVCLWQALVIDQQAQTQRTVEARTALLKKEMGLQVEAHILALERMAERWNLNGMTSEQQRKFDAALIVRDYHGVEVICSVDPSNHIGWTVSRDQDTDPGIDLALEGGGTIALERARSTGRVAVSPPIQLPTGSKGFLVFVPISDHDNFGGYIGGLFHFQHLLDTVLSEELMTGYGIVISEDDDEIYRRNDSNNQPATEWANTENLSLTGMRWRITVSPEKKTLAELRSSVSTVTLIGGLVISVILAWTVWLAQAAHKRAKIVGETSLDLERQIAERTIVEDALAGALEKERALFDNTLDVICSVDRGGRFVSVSPACFRLWGYRQEELVGHNYIDLVIPEDQQKTSEIAARIIKGEPITDFVNRYLHKDGSHVHTMWSSSWSTTLQLMFAVAHDVTDRVRVETALQESEQKFRSVTHSANDAIIAADGNGVIISWNQGASAMFGYLEEEILGQPLTQLMPEIYRLAHLTGLSRHAATDEAHVIGRTVELSGLRKSGGEFPLELSVGTWSNGSARFYSGIVRDITERKQIAAELVKSRDEAVESARLKAEFLANMSHEIRTPMNGVIGMTGLLLGTTLSSPQREYTKTIEASAEALLTIIDDILDFSKIEAGLLRFENIDFELRSDVEAAVELLAERAQAKGLELAVLVYPDVPTALRGDPGRLRQVLTNLIGNAVKFTERGVVVISVTKVGETSSHARVRFEIQDTGIGVSPESQRILFRAFTQADGSTTRKYGGTGLGLVISKQLVELMGGEIGVESIPGAGSTFWFTAGFERQAAPAPAVTKPVANLSGARVLIVDDNATNRNILKQQTTSWGMTATEAESGKQALDLLRASVAQGESYDIALLDLMMPEMDGFQLAEAIKSDPTIASVALVLLASFGTRGHGERARKTGVAAYLQKPVRQSQLYNCLTAVLAEVRSEPAPVPLVTKHSRHKSEVQPKGKALSSVRILIAEDNSTNQMVALGQLHNLGYGAQVVSNGRELLKALEKDEVDIILMDCQMPEMDGFAATAEIRRREGTLRHTTIIAMTANALDGDDIRCLAAGMDDYLSKPVKSEALRLKLERWTKPGVSRKGLIEASEPAQRTRDSIIDQAQLASLRTIPIANFLTELIDVFLSEANSQLRALNEAARINDRAEILRIAHLLKGSSANIGATRMSVLVEGLESTDPTKDAGQRLAQLAKEFKLVSEALEAEREELGELAPVSA